MLKKLLAFICGFVPFGAFAATENIPVTDVPNVNATTVTVSEDEIKAVQSGNALQIYGAGLTDGVALDVAGDMRVFVTPIPQQAGGTLFISDAVSDTFSLQADGDVDIGGTLTIAGGRTFNISNYTDDATFDVSVSTINNTGTFNVTDVNNFVVGTTNTDGEFLAGAIDTSGALSVQANNINVGAVTVDTGSAVVLNATNTLNIAQLNNIWGGGAEIDIAATNIKVGDISHTGAGTLDIGVAGNLNATGNVENSGNLMRINASDADIVVDGTMKNDAGQMVVNANSLTVNGGDANNASFVNGGILTIDVAGETNLANGFNLVVDSEDDWGNAFSLTTGSLVLGGNTSAFFANNLNNFDVVVDSSAFSTGDVSNGTLNANANMYLAANGLTVGNVKNNAGTMRLEALGATTNLVASGVVDAASATTNLIASGAVNVEGNVVASGTMTLQGQQVAVGGIVGNGGTLDVLATSGTTGLVTVNGDITDGNNQNIISDIDISGRQINIVGNVTNNYSDLTIDGSDFQGSSIKLGGVNVAGGTAYLNGLLGIDIAQSMVDENTFGTGTLNVTGGVLNIGSGTHSLTVGGPADNNGYVMNVGGDVVANATGATTGDGDIYVTAYGPMGFQFDVNGAVNVGGDVLATTAGTTARTLNFMATSFNIGGDVTATGAANRIVFQGRPLPTPLSLVNDAAGTADLTIGGDLLASEGGTVEIHSTDVSVDSLTEDNGTIYVYGNDSNTVNAVNVDVATGGVSIQSGITFDDTDDANRGLIVGGTSEFSLVSQATDKDIDIFGGINLGQSNRLNLNSGRNIQITGAVAPNGYLDIDAVGDVDIVDDMTVAGWLDIKAAGIDLADVTNNGYVILNSGDDINIGILKNGATAYELDIDAVGDVYATAIESAGALTDIDANLLDVQYGMDITGGTFNLNALNGATFGGAVNVAGVLNQGTGKTGMLNILSDEVVFSSTGLTAGGFVADSNVGTYDISGDITIDGDMTVGTSVSLATVNFIGETFNNISGDVDNLYTFRNYAAFKLDSSDAVSFDNIINSGALVLDAAHGITMATLSNSGSVSLDSGDDIVDMAGLVVDGGTIQLYGAGWTLDSELTTDGNLYQNYTGTLRDNDIGITADDYTITASNVTVAGINQTSGAMQILSSDVTVNGDINATDLTIAANPDTNWLDLEVNGNISGGTKIWNLEQMAVDGDYIFDANSQLLAAILPYNVTPGLNSTTRNYWSSVSLNNDATLGQITNATDGAALIQVNGKFMSGTEYSALALNSDVLADGQIGLRFTDVSNVSAETAIWLLKAEQGLSEFSDIEKIRNLNVLFCNAGNTTCVALNPDNLGAYITTRDTDNSGAADSLYVVFDPRFGGPVLIEDNRIQPIVARQPEYTAGEYVAAGALDNLIAGQLLNMGFFNKSPIEVIPAIFEGTNVETLMTELYNRMEHYVETANGAAFVPFSRLVQPREIEQIAGAIALNEHTSFRNFEDRMFDEFIWNRNRNLKKAWADFDFGMFSQNVTDDKRVYGNRFELSGGFDWQSSDTLILGLTGRVSHMSSDNADDMDLGYLPGQNIVGNVSVDVADTNVGLGAYLMKTLGHKFRLYGNAFMDMHFIDTTRHMTFMDTIDGTGTAFALTTEWGLMHDWLNQYVVGNLYARAGYNFGFDVTEKAAGENYMDFESDGYLMLTPGYSLTAQKRIYPSAWFQIRPYATIGVEYDVLGAPDFAKYKFASANVFSEYDIEIDPLWANIGGGFEFLSANGLQFGIDYRYQYNNDMQLHNIKVSGSYRF
ncbi:MAG: hypothetical protein E7009_01930 [Alphaproteobacteria bacterium]|nr:hypothetical protein [Alphaproteobacteria bacterium]